MFAIRIWENYKYEPDAIGIKCNNHKNKIGYNIHRIPFKNSSLLLLITSCFIMLDFHGLFLKTIKSTLVFSNCVLLGWVIIHCIIQQYSRTCMDIHSKNSSGLEEKTDMTLSVILTLTQASPYSRTWWCKQWWWWSFEKYFIKTNPWIPCSYIELYW